jgi:hypothetical protein
VSAKALLKIRREENLRGDSSRVQETENLMSTRSPAARSLFDPSTARGLWLRWLPTFLGFPVGGLIAMAVPGPVTSLTNGLIGGAVAGAVLGAAQWLALRGRLSKVEWWIPATAVGQAVGLAAGAALVGYRTGLQDLAIQGAITGIGVGILQALVLRPHVATWFWWAIAMPPLWALGWIVTTLGGVQVDQHFTNFGAYGAITFAVLSGLLLVQLLRSDVAVRPAVAAA